MKNKIGTIVLSSIILLIFFPACNKTESPILFSSIGTVESDNRIYLDEDNIYIYAVNGLPSGYDVGSRVILFFNINKTAATNAPYTYEINLVNIQRISTSGITFITDPAADTLYKNPIVGLQRMWLSRNFLTVDFTYYAFDTTLHSFMLSDRVDVNKPIADIKYNDTVLLNFRHNAGSDEKGSLHRALLSFDLAALRPLDRDSVVLSVKTLVYQNDSTNTTNTRYFVFK